MIAGLASGASVLALAIAGVFLMRRRRRQRVNADTLWASSAGAPGQQIIPANFYLTAHSQFDV
jgi:hypothetical protein